ncbi:MAG: AAA family ATPase [Thermodesulfobacteriota bacterium]
MRIETISIRNFRVFRNTTLEAIPPMSVLVGANGSGKSTLFDVFGFLKDALTENVYTAFAKRGGFQEVRSRGSDDPISVEIKFREGAGRLVTYHLSMVLADGHPVVDREILKYRRGRRGQPWKFLDFTRGRGQVITNEADYGKPDAEMQREPQELDSPDILAIKGLGQFQRFKVVSEFRKLIENWHASDFHVEEARPRHGAGYAEHLSRSGDNLALVTKFLYERHPAVFNDILKKMTRRVPGVSLVEATSTVDGHVVLRFQEGAFQDPFVARQVSDGTIKMFAYLVLLHDPSPHPLLCVEEPENYLYPKLLSELAEEFRDYSLRGGQVFISTHSPDFLNGANIDEIFWLEKRDGHSVVRRAKDIELLARLVQEGDKPGWLWSQGFFGVDLQ